MAVMRDVLEAIHQRRSSANPGSDLFATIDPYVLTAAETAASVTPTNFSYAELDARRYGFSASATATANTTALQAAISVLAQHSYGELVIPQGIVANVNQVIFGTMSKFNVRCDGTLVCASAAPGSAFTNQTASQGSLTPFRIGNCSQFKIYGKGYINPGFVDALWIVSCSDFDISLDCLGSGQNSFMAGIFLEYCTQFRIHDMTVDNITAQNMQNAQTATAVINAGATSATAATWTGGAFALNVTFSTGEQRVVTFGSGTSNVSMTWSGGLSNNATATFYAEIFYNWLNSVAIFSCTDFSIDHNMVRKSGMNGIYVLSVSGAISTCQDFSIESNTCEFNACSGIQITWNGGTTPSRYKCNNNTLRYNQADGIDAANTSGSMVPIYAQFNGNQHFYNGWINCNPANPGGGDGSGLGTFTSISYFECVGGIAYEPNNAGVAVNNAANFHISHFAVTKTNTGGNQSGIVISSPISYGSIENGDVITAGLPTVSMQSSSDLTLQTLRLTGGQTAISNGVYTNCKMLASRVECNSAVNWVFDLIDCDIVVTGGTAQGIVASNPSIRAIRCNISAPGAAINTNGQNYIAVEDCTTNTSGAASAMLVNASSGVRIVGGQHNSTGGGSALQTLGTCDRTYIANTRVNSTSGNGLNTSAGSTNTLLLSVTQLSGSPSLSGSFLTGMNQP